jgi:F0F1-type ATP synthase membrane subunit b/b'
MDILRLLDELNQLAVEQPRKLPILPLYWGLNQDDISMQIAKVRASLPQELKQAVTAVRESERILEGAKEDAGLALESAKKEGERVIAEARAEAQRIVEQARLQQEQMVADSEILKISKAQSEEIRSAADREASQLRRNADKYAYDVLSQLEGVVSKVMTTVEKGKQEMSRTDAAVVAAPVVAGRERSRV